MSRTHIYKTCKNMECASKKDKSLGNIWGDPMHEIHAEDGRYFTTCSICKDVAHFKDPDHSWKQSYPYVNASLDKEFHSKSEERAYAKANNLGEVAPGTKMRDVAF
jgi:hypothetical protein